MQLSCPWYLQLNRFYKSTTYENSNILDTKLHIKDALYVFLKALSSKFGLININIEKFCPSFSHFS